MMKTALFIILFSFTAAFSFPRGNSGENPKTPESYKQLMSIALKILEGNYSPELKENISPEAYIINNNSYQYLFEVLQHQGKDNNFIEGKGIRAEFFHVWMSDDMKTAYMVLETKSSDNIKTNWHSIYFEIGKNKKWQIMSWHKS